MYKDLRMQSLQGLLKMPLMVMPLVVCLLVNPRKRDDKVLDYLPCAMPNGKPRYLMGVGKPADIVEAVRRGVDMFDCVMPTRNARK